MVEEPKPKKSGRRRVKNLNTPLTIKEKKARKSAQDLLREKKQDLEKAQANYWSTKSKLKKLDITAKVQHGVFILPPKNND